MLFDIVWNPDPAIFSIGGFALRWYGACWAVAFALCYLVIVRIFRKENIDTQYADSLLIYVFLGTFIGARLGHCLFYDADYYLAHPLEIAIPIVKTASGWKFIGYAGLASHGATVGIITSLWLYARKYNFSLWDLWDKIALVAPLGGGFIRLGNFFNSEIIGAPTDMPWGVTFSKVDMLPRHPAQLYEAIGYFIIFAIAYYVYTRKRKQLGEGFVFGLSVFLIFTIRFFIEYIKEVQEPFELAMRENWGIDMGQLLSIPFMVVCAGIMFYAFRRNKNRTVITPTSSATSGTTSAINTHKKPSRKFKKR